MTFPRSLKALRDEREMSQDELATAMNTRYGTKLNRPTISRWENGLQEASMHHVRLIAEYFNVSLDAINGQEPLQPSMQPDPRDAEFACLFANLPEDKKAFIIQAMKGLLEGK